MCYSPLVDFGIGFQIFLFVVELLVLSLSCRESEGTFEYGNYQREPDDLRAVIQYFSGANRVITGILGHSKGAIFNP